MINVRNPVASLIHAIDQRAAANPRIAQGKSIGQWERERAARRRAEWESRTALRGATVPVRDVRPDPYITLMRQNSVTDRSIRLDVEHVHQRPERGESAGVYFARKWERLGTLGEHEAMNPFLDKLRKGPADAHN